MFDFLNGLLRDLLHGRPRPEVAKFSAYVLAPVAVMSIAVGLSGGPGIDLNPVAPLSVSTLRTEIRLDGTLIARPGLALVVEPPSADLRIPIDGVGDRIWTSLDESSMRANRDRLFVDGGGFVSRAPLIGVDEPVALVVEGRVGAEIQTVGGKDRIEYWATTARRSGSILSGVLLAFVFAFGMAVATGVPTRVPNQDRSGKESTQPH